MSTIVTRSGKGSPLSHVEVDANFTNLNTDKYQSGNNASFGTLAATGVATFSAGTVSAPAITTTGDTNTGIFFPAADTIAFAEGGAESMRIDSSGNVGIGTSSPSTYTNQQLVVFGQGIANACSTGTTTARFEIFSNGQTNNQITLSQGFGGTDNIGYLYNRANAAFVFGTNNTERMRITSAGEVCVGTTTPLVASGARGNITINGTDAVLAFGNSGTNSAYIFNNSSMFEINAIGSRTINFTSNATERMRIDSSGNLLVGTTSSSGTITTKASTANGSTNAFQAQNSASTQLCAIRSDGLFNMGLAANSPYNYTTGSGANAFLNASGELQRSTSSLKYKTDVQDATFGISDVMKLRPVTYKSKSETDGDTNYAGLIAEEVDAIGLKEFVQYAEDGTPDAISYGNMVALAFKAIQEQQAMIETLTTRLNALEGK